jgi:ferrous-iron efflux pump FieF
MAIPDPATSENGRLRRLAAAASLSVAVLLVLLKTIAALLTGSIAVLSSLVDSVADIAASAITFLSVRVALQPPDRRHRYGHGKAESLSALAQGALVAGSGLFVLVGAGRRLLNPERVDSTGIGLVVMIFATLVTLALVLFQRSVVRRTGSQAIGADSLHYLSDLITNLGVIVSLLASRWLDALWLDPLIGALIALYLLKSAFNIVSGAIGTLMDHELPAGDRERIAATVRGHVEVYDLHDLRTREASGTRFIEFHIELDGNMTVREAHDVTDLLEDELGRLFVDAEIIIHQEPAGLEDARLDDRIKAASDPPGA